MSASSPNPLPLIRPLGDAGLLVRFGDSLSEAANAAALSFAARATEAALAGVEEVVPNLVSVLLRYDPTKVGFDQLAGEVRLLVSEPATASHSATHVVEIAYDGDDLDEVCALVGLERSGFIAAHKAATLRVLAIGFAPGFAYCGFHEPRLHVPRRQTVRPGVPAGTILFAAGQTAITATALPTGWHIIGHTNLRNFAPDSDPVVTLRAGDVIQFREAR